MSERADLEMWQTLYLLQSRPFTDDQDLRRGLQDICRRIGVADIRTLRRRLSDAAKRQYWGIWIKEDALPRQKVLTSLYRATEDGRLLTALRATIGTKTL